MRLRVCVYVCTSDEFGAEEKQWVSRSQRVSIEKSKSEYREVEKSESECWEVREWVSRRKTEQSESCEKENRMYWELRKLSTSLFIININKPILFIQLQINKQPFHKIPKIGGSSKDSKNWWLSQDSYIYKRSGK